MAPRLAANSFGDLLRQHRVAAGLTQEALAERAGLSVHGIQKLERGGTHPYRDTVRRLMSGLQLSPEETLAFQAAANPAPRNRGSETQRSSGEFQHDLPAPLTSFIGREREKDQIAQLLSNTRLLTLTGVEGCGKTRLALEVARLVYDTYPEGVHLVELASIADATLVPQAVATTLGIRETASQPILTTLTTTLRATRILIVLDNCEHLLNACARLAHALLVACPRIHILATSREALGLAGEISRRVPSLPVPPMEPSLTGAALAGYAAAQLFVERARAVQPGFDTTDRNAASIVQICNRLDGIPLALELAAARVGGISVEHLAGRLDQRFRLLTGGSRAALPRQQTLRATIDWSYALLSEAEKTLFARLSVFAGSWTLEAAETVCAGDGIERDAVVELLLRLVAKSLVVAEEDVESSGRYRLLDTLRQYGRERSLDAGHSDVLHEQHALYYLTLAERAEAELNRQQQSAWIQLLAAEYCNLRAALEWLMAGGDVQRALRLAGVLSRFWEVRAHLREGRERLADVLALPGAAAPTLARARVLDGAGVLALYQFDVRAARPVFKESLALHRQHEDWHGVAWALIHLGWLCHDTARLKAAHRFLREALELCQRLGDRRGVARSLTLLGNVTLLEGDLRTARSIHEQCLRLNREVGDHWGTAWALNNLGEDLLLLAEVGQGDALLAEPVLQECYEIWSEFGERRHLAFANSDLGVAAVWRKDLILAKARLDESLATFADLGDASGCIYTLCNCALLFDAECHYLDAVRVLGAATALWRATLRRFRPIEDILVETRLRPARAALDARLFAAAWSEGEAMSLEEAGTYAHQQLSSNVG
jgi:non-specific serine/threonine protein kinase